MEVKRRPSVSSYGRLEAETSEQEALARVEAVLCTCIISGDNMSTRNELFLEAHALANKPILRREDLEAFSRLTERIDGRYDGFASREEFEASRRSGFCPIPRGQPGDGNAGYEEHQLGGGALGGGARRNSPERRAFESFIIRGETYKENRDLGTVTGGAITAGAQFVPEAFYPVLTEAKKMWGNVIEAVTVRETDDGAPMKVAYSNDTGNMAHVVGELGPVVETDPSLSSFLLSTDMCVTDIIKISIAEMTDSAFDLDAFVRDQFGKRYYRGLTSMVTNGSSSGNIGSIVNGAYPGVTSISNNSIGYADIVSMFGNLDPAYVEGSSWMMKSTTRSFLMGITDSLNRPLFIPSPTSGTFDTLLGRPVILNQYLDLIVPSTSSPVFASIPLLFGDFKQGYLLRNVKPGLAIARMNERYLDTLEIGFLGFFRSGGMVTDAGTHPIVGLTMHT